MLHHPVVKLLIRWVINALGVILAAQLVAGIQYSNTASLGIVVVLLSFFNAFLRPLLVLFALPFVVLTMGVGILFINALLFLLAANMVPGFSVAGFGSAFLGSLIVSLTSLVLSGLINGRSPVQPKHRRRPPDDDDVIDI